MGPGRDGGESQMGEVPQVSGSPPGVPSPFPRGCREREPPNRRWGDLSSGTWGSISTRVSGEVHLFVGIHFGGVSVCAGLSGAGSDTVTASGETGQGGTAQDRGRGPGHLGSGECGASEAVGRDTRVVRVQSSVRGRG